MNKLNDFENTFNVTELSDKESKSINGGILGWLLLGALIIGLLVGIGTNPDMAEGIIDDAK